MKRKILDATIFILFLLVMSFHFLPRILHEIFGVIMAAAVVMHFFINRRQFFYLLRGKKTPRKIFSFLTIFFMLIIFLIFFVSGIFISNHLFHDFVSFELRRNFFVHQLHVSLPYLFIIFLGCHIGLHWREIIKIKNSALQKIFITIIICAGIYGSFLNRAGDRILMKHIFATPATDLPWGIFLFLFISTIGIYAAITFLIDEFFKNRK